MSVVILNNEKYKNISNVLNYCGTVEKTKITIIYMYMCVCVYVTW